jgi:hypothetical protein
MRSNRETLTDPHQVLARSSIIWPSRAVPDYSRRESAWYRVGKYPCLEMFESPGNTKPADERRFEGFRAVELCAAAERLRNFRACRGNNVKC